MIYKLDRISNIEQGISNVEMVTTAASSQDILKFRIDCELAAVEHFEIQSSLFDIRYSSLRSGESSVAVVTF